MNLEMTDYAFQAPLNEIIKHYPEIKGIHPVADLFPLLTREEFQELAESIRDDGIQNPVALDKNGLLLDGRNRVMACYTTGTELIFTRYLGSDAVQFALRQNLHRRHLNAGQRAVVALKVRELLQPAAKERQREAGEQFGRGAKVPAELREPIKATTATKERVRETAHQAAKAVGASPRAVEQAARVAKSAPDLLPKVQAGTMALDRAHREAQQRERQQAASRPQPEMPQVVAATTITLLDHQGNPYEYPKPKSKATFNQQKGTEIGWALWSWNPVTGCNHGCNYCYARAIATSRDMAAYYPAGFTPLFHHERIDAPGNTPVPEKAKLNPAYGRVFVCSMADLFGAWVPQDWIEQVVAATAENPQWEYLYLTKFPQRYHRLALPRSGWIGASVDSQNRAEPTLEALAKVDNVKHKWLSLEPLLEPISFSSLKGIDWIVIGAQSANAGQNDAFAPCFEWVADLVATARRDGCAVWLKTNLLGETGPQWPGMRLLQEIPSA